MSETKFRETVRMLGVNLVGSNVIFEELMKIKGVGPSLARAIPSLANIPERLRVGMLTDTQVEKLEALIKDIGERLPAYLINRRNDRESGRDLHLVSSDLSFKVMRDIDFEKKIKSWRGIRHRLGLKVRGQRTKTTGRRGRTVGVRAKKR
ncbi:MAG: 30S ribosomal protein S13 [Nitrososphaeria archaeon]|nr:30S ribosomal protein S13 [Nitrososphaeria archaeon]NIN52378.1 30S ribosomal protein S13 [Nitrososphaeria archaeon]NIQ32866.1 30S ribosomal protein S13 [Nitrososphaeria archaeon]